MSKLLFILTGICLTMLALVYLWIITPNQDQKAVHQATLCNVIRQHKTILQPMNYLSWSNSPTVIALQAMPTISRSFIKNTPTTSLRAI